jgi:hypothetical protein
MARQTAAAVPASKVKIGEVYAINYGEDEKGDDKLVRFRVTAVVTRRESDHGNPHDYKSKVEGYVFGPDSGGKEATLTIDPGQLLGLYTEHVELVEREMREKAARDAVTAEREAKRKALWLALYDATGIEPPADERDFNAAFKYAYGTGLEIRAEGVEPLLKFFELLKAVKGDGDSWKTMALKLKALIDDINQIANS